MTLSDYYILSATLLVIGVSAKGQGTFQDLNFEGANVVPIVGDQNYPYAVTVANALPGWTVSYGSAQQSQILYNQPSTGQTAVTLFADGYPPNGRYTAVDGNFSVLLQGGSFDGSLANASISQTGQIPDGTQSLFFSEADVGQLIPPVVLVGSDVLTLFPVGTGTGTGTTYETYGANISEWGGQTEQLTFSAPYGNILMDNISFSPNALTTPEPDPLTLMSVGGLLFGLYRRFLSTRK